MSHENNSVPIEGNTESHLKHFKRNLDRYKNLLNNIERHDIFAKSKSKANLINIIKPELDEIEKLKLEIDKNIQTISSLISNEDDKFIFNRSRSLYKEHMDKYKNIQKAIKRIDDSSQLNALLNQEMDELSNQKSLDILHSENDSILNCINQASQINQTAMEADKELKAQDRIINKNQLKILDLINKVPIINKALSSIKFHRYKERVVLGLVIGFIIFFTFYLTS